MRSRRELIRATKVFAQEDRRRSWWHLGSTLALLVGLFSATCLEMPWPLRLTLSVLTGLMIVRMFGIYHDYLHGAILRRAWLADVIFTAYGLLMLTPPSIWKRSHDHHHHHNGQYFGASTGTFPLMTTAEYAQANGWQRLQYVVVRHPLAMLLGYFTIFLYSMCLYHVLTKPRQHLDAAAALLLQAGLVTGLAIFAPGALVLRAEAPKLLCSCCRTIRRSRREWLALLLFVPTACRFPLS